MNKARISAQRPFSMRRRSSPREIGRKLLILVLVVGLCGILVIDGIRYLGSLVPFPVERQMAMPYAANLAKPDALSLSLNQFAEKIAIAQGIPPEVPIEVRVINHDWIQSYATIGGYIILYKGLLAELKSEEALAALLAHQIAHLVHRHPAQALGKRVNVGLLLSVVSQDLAAQIAAPSFSGGLRTEPFFSREHEEQAHVDTGATLVTLYGHLGGALDLGSTLQRLIAAKPESPPGMITTHPGWERVADDMGRLAQERDWKIDSADGKRRPAPDWLNAAPPAK